MKQTAWQNVKGVLAWSVAVGAIPLVLNVVAAILCLSGDEYAKQAWWQVAVGWACAFFDYLFFAPGFLLLVALQGMGPKLHVSMELALVIVPSLLLWGVIFYCYSCDARRATSGSEGASSSRADLSRESLVLNHPFGVIVGVLLLGVLAWSTGPRDAVHHAVKRALELRSQR